MFENLNKYSTLTPGPTNIRENVRMARAFSATNPDLDHEFYDFYKDTCNLLSQLLDTVNPSYILSGEGILGLEAACASLTEAGDRVLVIDNGIFGHYFADFVNLYGGNTVFFRSDYKRAVCVEELKCFLENDSDFKYATVVHCDTPTGVLNPVEDICRLLHHYGIISVVDSVAGMFGEPLSIDNGHIDILCGGSQKALSAPPGLTVLWVSEDAFKIMEKRKTPIASYYCNILSFKNYYENKWFPYTMPIHDIMGLRVAIENIIADKGIYERHHTIGTAVRKALSEYGLNLYLDDNFSSTVTAFKAPTSIDVRSLLHHLKVNYSLILADSLDMFANEIIRIGHMGENARFSPVYDALFKLQRALEDFGYVGIGSLSESFKTAYDEIIANS